MESKLELSSFVQVFNLFVICRNHVLESLPYIGSPASVILMKDQIVKNQIPTDLANQWMESFAYLTR